MLDETQISIPSNKTIEVLRKYHPELIEAILTDFARAKRDRNIPNENGKQPKGNNQPEGNNQPTTREYFLSNKPSKEDIAESFYQGNPNSAVETINGKFNGIGENSQISGVRPQIVISQSELREGSITENKGKKTITLNNIILPQAIGDRFKKDENGKILLNEKGKPIENNYRATKKTYEFLGERYQVYRADDGLYIKVTTTATANNNSPYSQNKTYSNGEEIKVGKTEFFKLAPIAFDVIYEENGNLICLSQKVLFNMPMHTKNQPTDYKSSLISAYLNGLKMFENKGFTDEAVRNNEALARLYAKHPQVYSGDLQSQDTPGEQSANTQPEQSANTQLSTEQSARVKEIIEGINSYNKQQKQGQGLQGQGLQGQIKAANLTNNINNNTRTVFSELVDAYSKKKRIKYQNNATKGTERIVGAEEEFTESHQDTRYPYVRESTPPSPSKVSFNIASSIIKEWQGQADSFGINLTSFIEHSSKYGITIKPEILLAVGEALNLDLTRDLSSETKQNIVAYLASAEIEEEFKQKCIETLKIKIEEENIAKSKAENEDDADFIKEEETHTHNNAGTSGNSIGVRPNGTQQEFAKDSAKKHEEERKLDEINKAETQARNLTAEGLPTSDTLKGAKKQVEEVEKIATQQEDPTTQIEISGVKSLAQQIAEQKEAQEKEKLRRLAEKEAEYLKEQIKEAEELKQIEEAEEAEKLKQIEEAKKVEELKRIEETKKPKRILGGGGNKEQALLSILMGGQGATPIENIDEEEPEESKDAEAGEKPAEDKALAPAISDSDAVAELGDSADAVLDGDAGAVPDGSANTGSNQEEPSKPEGVPEQEIVDSQGYSM